MNSRYKNLEDLVPLSERIAEIGPFEVGDRSSDMIIRILRVTVSTGMIATTNKRLKRGGAALIYQGRCVGSSYGNDNDSNWEESFSKVLLDLETPDTVITLYRLTTNLVVAISSIYVGVTIYCPDDLSPPKFASHTLKWLAKNGGTAVIEATEGVNKELALLTYVFRGEQYGTYVGEDRPFLARDNNVLKRILSDRQVEICVHVLSESTDGYGIALQTTDEGGSGGTGVGARIRPMRPEGGTSIALPLPLPGKDSEGNS